MGYEMTKVLANSDVDYWRQMPAKESHQSAIFIGSAQGEKVCGLLGEAKTGDAVKIVLNRSNLIRVLTAHYEAKDQFFSSRNLGQWTITIEYLKQCLEQILAVFRTEEEVFIASVNRQTSAQNCRAWIKGLQPELKREDGTCGISIFDFLFSGDTLHFIRDDAWNVHIEIIPKVVTSVLGGSEKGLLRVGDVFSGKGNETYEVIGVEPHAYRIRFNKTGKIRTTPKTVVAAWYKFYKEHPFVDYDIEKKGTVEHKTNVPIREASSRALRDQYLNTSTEDDPFEHAYDGMLGNIARWLLDNPREEEEEPQNDTQLPTADFLTVALKLFSEKRKDGGTEGWQKEGWNVNGRVRAYFGGLTQAQIMSFTEAQFEEFFLGPIDPVTGKHKSDEAMMWAGSTGSGWDSIKPDKPADIMPALAGMAKIQQDPGVAAFFLKPGTTHPKGFGPSVTSELLMKFHPDVCFKHGRVTHEVLTLLRMIDFPYKSNFSDSEYKQVCGEAAKIRDKMNAMKLPRQINADGTEDNAPPDYLTVNEFIWFVNKYKDTISKECEAKMIKKADYSQASSKPAGKKPKVDFGNAEDVVLLRLAAALRAKPFAILAGHSGTGKSRMVRKLAYMTCAKGGYKALLEGADGKPAATPGNFCMVQVKPNWHDSTDLLGYYSEIRSAFRTTDFVKFICKAYAYPDVPFFVCLDEMNLAPVEQYFAEYLSAIESRKVKDDAEFLDGDGNAKTGPKVITDTLLDKSVWKSASDLGCEFTQSAYWVEKHGLTIPRNLFVVGTVNMDESTNQFSRKVLDRAFTLEMTDADFEHFGEQSPEPSYDDYAGDDFVKELLAGKLFASELTADHKLKSTQVNNLNKLKPILADSSFVVAYRFANEYALYEDALEKMLPQFDSSSSAGGASAGTSTGATESPATDGTTQSVTGADGAPQPAAADGTQQPVAGGAGDSQGAASPSAKPEAFDDMILMKLLPRITGDAELVLRIFTGKEDAQLDDADVKGLAGLLEKKGASFKKMKEIVKRGGTSLTFWP